MEEKKMNRQEHENEANNVWASEIAAYKKQENIRQSSFELDRTAFSELATNALFSLAKRHVNSVRKKNGETPYPPGHPTLPNNVAAWIQTQISDIDNKTGNIGTHTYQ